MARRNDHSKEEIIEMAIAAGKRILDKEGAASFSARKVAKKIGYTVGTIYNIFDTHANLVLRINAVTLDDMKRFIADKVGKKKTSNIRTYMRKLADAYVEFANNNYNSWNALFEFNVVKELPLPSWYANEVKSLFTFIELPLQQLAGCNKRSAEQSAKIIWASIHGICQLGITDKLNIVGDSSVKKLTDSFIDTYILGLKSK